VPSAAAPQVEVTVRGTQEALDWLIDLAAVPVASPTGVDAEKVVPNQARAGPSVPDSGRSEQVHAGFRAQFKQLFEPIRKARALRVRRRDWHDARPQAIAPFQASVKAGKTELVFYGHSLGGAVSQLLADEFARAWGESLLSLGCAARRSGPTCALNSPAAQVGARVHVRLSARGQQGMG
jgi:hypothetical protein